MKNLIMLLVLLLSVLCNANDDEEHNPSPYCNLALCVNDDHIACKNDEGFGEACSLIRYVVDIEPLKDLIIHKHNKIRNEVAKGLAFGLRQARKMIKIKWDEELAHLATYNVKRCVQAHDNCHNTQRFRNSGQNVGSAVGQKIDTTKTIATLIDLWYNQSRHVKQEYIDSYKIIAERIRAYTVMINDRQTHIGCAGLIKGLPSDAEALYFCCNYAHTNVVGQSVYEPGDTGSCCENGTDSTYLGLCGEDTTATIPPPPPEDLKSSSAARNYPLWLITIFNYKNITVNPSPSKFHTTAIRIVAFELVFFFGIFIFWYAYRRLTLLRSATRKHSLFI